MCPISVDYGSVVYGNNQKIKTVTEQRNDVIISVMTGHGQET